MILDDDIEPGQDLVCMNVVGLHSEDLSKLAVLEQKNIEIQRRNLVKDSFVLSSGEKKDDALCCVCENCGYVFYRSDDCETFSCPHCQARHHFVPAEEMYVTRVNQDSSLLLSLAMKEREMERRQVAGVTHSVRQDTKVDDAKTQASLAPGSDEYKAYVEDIQANDPGKPDDAFHSELEAQNAIHLQENDADSFADTNEDAGHLVERRALSEAGKREIHDEVKADLARVAATTKTKSDDIRVAGISKNNAALHDVNVDVSDYGHALGDAVGLPDY